MKKLSLIIVLLLVTTLVWAQGWKEIAPKRVRNLQKEGSGLWLIDVRAQGPFERVHAESSVNIPAMELRYKQLAKQKMIVLVDNTLGQLDAQEAADVLAKKEMKRVYVLKGGLSGWQKAGLPLAGDVSGWELARLAPGELEKALRSDELVEVYDFRSDAERELGAFENYSVLAGETLEEQFETLHKITEKRSRKDLAGQLKEATPIVAVLPASVDARAMYHSYLWDMPLPVRILEGGYAAYAAPRARLTSTTPGGCSTCPGTAGNE